VPISSEASSSVVPMKSNDRHASVSAKECSLIPEGGRGGVRLGGGITRYLASGNAPLIAAWGDGDWVTLRAGS
jgi:hypothetical protein